MRDLVTIIRVPRLRRMSLRVKPTGEVVVRAGKLVTTGEIHRFTRKSQKWIEKQRRSHGELRPLTSEEIASLWAQAQAVLPERTRYLAQKLDFSYRRVTLRHQRSRWGSCSRDNAISLNIELMRLPPELCDYIIVHELTHTLHKHHQDAFWDYLEKVFPGSLELDREMRKWKLGFHKKA